MRELIKTVHTVFSSSSLHFVPLKSTQKKETEEGVFGISGSSVLYCRRRFGVVLWDAIKPIKGIML